MSVPVRDSKGPVGGVRRALLALGALGLAALGVWVVLTWRSPLPASPLEAVPERSVAVASVRLRALRAAPAWRALVGEDGDRGMREAERICGFDPLSLVEDATLFVTGEEDVGLEHVGFVARGAALQGTRFLDCVRRVVAEDRGGVREMRIEGERALASAHGSGRAAFVRSDGVAGGTELSVAAVIRTLRGDEPSAARDPQLRGLWERVGAGGRELALVARVPAAWRRVLVARLAARSELRALTRVVASDLAALVDGPADVRASTCSAARRRALCSDGRRGDPRARRRARRRRAARRSAARSARCACEAGGPDAVGSVDLDAAQLRALAALVREALRPAAGDAAPAPLPTPDAVLRPARP